jgi:hypothetical protein
MKYTISPENMGLSAATHNLLIHLEKEYDDIGHYSVTDGEILQEKSRCNFTYSSTGNTVSVFNSVDRLSFTELRDATFTIYWGDGSSSAITIEQTLKHTYSTSGEYVIILSLDTPWSEKVYKTIQVGQTITRPNPLGTLTIQIPYSEAEIDQDYITQLDAECQDLDQEGVIVSGFTQSRLKELIKYGQSKPVEGIGDDGNGVFPGGITSGYTVYTIDGILYTDFADGLTYYSLEVGENPLEFICALVTKEEALIGVVSDIEVQSDVYVERGKISVFEHNLRLSEIDSVGEIEVYGNKYFNVKRTT